MTDPAEYAMRQQAQQQESMQNIFRMMMALKQWQAERQTAGENEQWNRNIEGRRADLYEQSINQGEEPKPPTEHPRVKIMKYLVENGIAPDLQTAFKMTGQQPQAENLETYEKKKKIDAKYRPPKAPTEDKTYQAEAFRIKQSVNSETDKIHSSYNTAVQLIRKDQAANKAQLPGEEKAFSDRIDEAKKIRDEELQRVKDRHAQDRYDLDIQFGKGLPAKLQGKLKATGSGGTSVAPGGKATKPTAPTKEKFKIGEIRKAKGKTWKYIGNDQWQATS